MLTSTVDALKVLKVKELLESALGSLRAVIWRGTTQVNGTGEGTYWPGTPWKRATVF